MRLSVVIAARNDDYLTRLLRSLWVFGKLAGANHLDYETVIVEWNPPRLRPSLASMIAAAGFHARVVTVPREIHEAQRGADVLPFFEYIAKNVGIRKALGDYVLTTNADDIYSGELVGRLANEELTEGRFYRANRSDVTAGTIRGNNVDEVLASAAANVYRVVEDFEGAAGDFTMMVKGNWEIMHGHPELVSDDTIDSYTVEIAAAHGWSKVVFPEPMYHQGHTSQRNGWASIGGGTSPDQSAGARENGDDWGLGKVGAELPEVRT